MVFNPTLFFTILIISSLIVSVFSMLPFQEVYAPLPVLTAGQIETDLVRPGGLATYDICEAVTVTGFFESLSEVDNRLIWMYCEGVGSTPQTWFLFAANYTQLDSCAADADRGNNHFCPSPPYGHIYPANDFSFVMMDAGCELQKVTMNSTSDIYVSASFSLGSCGTGVMAYDQAGFYWHTSTSDDKVRMLNLFGMFTEFASPSLDDGGAMDCDVPVSAAADFDAFKVYIVCDNGDGFTYVVSADFDYVAPNYTWGGKIERLQISPDDVCASGQSVIQSIGLRNDLLIFECDATGDILRVSHENDGTGLTLEAPLVTGVVPHHGLCEPYASNFIICGVSMDGAYRFFVYNGTAAPYQVASVNCSGCVSGGESGFNGYNFGSTWIMPAVDNANEAGFLVVEGVAEAFPYIPLPPEDFDETCVVEEDEDCDNIPDIIDPDCDGDGIANLPDDDDNGNCLVSDPIPGPGEPGYTPGTWPVDMLDLFTFGGLFSTQTAGLLLSFLIHLGTVGSLLALGVMARSLNSIPGAVWFIFMLFGSVISVAMGFMPLLFWFAEIAVIGLALAFTVPKMIGGGAAI